MQCPFDSWGHLVCTDLKMFRFFQITCYSQDYHGTILFHNLITPKNARYPPHITEGFEFQLIGNVCAWTLDEVDYINSSIKLRLHK